MRLGRGTETRPFVGAEAGKGVAHGAALGLSEPGTDIREREKWL